MEVLVSLLRACMAPRWITSSLGGTTSSVFLTHLELLKSELLVDGPVQPCSSRRMLGDAPTNQPSVQGAENPASPSPEMYLSSTRPQGLCHPVAVAMHTVQEGRLAITRLHHVPVGSPVGRGCPRRRARTAERSECPSSTRSTPACSAVGSSSHGS